MGAFGGEARLIPFTSSINLKQLRSIRAPTYSDTLNSMAGFGISTICIWAT